MWVTPSLKDRRCEIRSGRHFILLEILINVLREATCLIEVSYSNVALLTHVITLSHFLKFLHNH